jgi:hypothetical protein
MNPTFPLATPTTIPGLALPDEQPPAPPPVIE